MATTFHPANQAFLDDLAAGMREHRSTERAKSQRINNAMARLDEIARSFRTPTAE